MPGKKKEIKKETPKMTPAQYWEWRCTLEEVKAEKLNKEILQEQMKIFQRDLAIAQLQLEKNREAQSKQNIKISKMQKDYEKFMLDLGEEIGCSFENTTIDPITYEIMKDEDLISGN